MGRKHVKRQATPQAPVSETAMRQVLGCYETFYLICTFMDMPTLLHAQLVSKHWHDMISTSPLLQQNLFLKPRPSVNIEEPSILNPLLLKHFEKILKGMDYHHDTIYYNTTAIFDMGIANMKDGRKVHKAFIRRDASWRRMLIAQPPITSIGYVEKVNNDDENWRLLPFPEGLCMGDLYDMVFQAIWGKPDEAHGSAYVDFAPFERHYYNMSDHMLTKWKEMPPMVVGCAALQKQCQYPTSRRGGAHRAVISERRRRLSKKNNDRPGSGTTQISTDATIPELDVELMHCTDIALPDEDMIPGARLLNESYNTLEGGGLGNDPLILSYYKNFHVFHPFVLPLPQLIKLCEGPSASPFDFTPLTTVMRLIGNIYDAQEWSISLQEDAESRISQLSSSDPVQVQCRLLYSIALFWSSYTTKASEEKDIATNVALELGMHKGEFASASGAGDAVLMESWRRTWWMLYIVDAYYAGTLGTMNFKTFHVEATVSLPCEEDEYESCVSVSLSNWVPWLIMFKYIPEPRTVEDFDSREFAENDIPFSSFAYLIGAVRAAALAISVTPKKVKRQDSERMIQVADAVIDAWLLLLPKERKVMRNDGSIDELMFQANLLVHV
ncbi:hypothetical protein FPSE_05949 [Fusarium pseudograminearum CS3096]|uniref:Xylanolytic transcriptional activator regulatory domain-containing protein n=1 Tax=Fusarium pseudograminearum (strain CS3096) TaxID=1028729 RepID=K3UNM4_FUSPC|nr:hypothetical protein FPSE_05949 [Fusarium pseudograminearum CS3096]EKJ73826.1 hypothetical protein FPSE_05949 [Fusarium pseudograminearum CS3096]